MKQLMILLPLLAATAAHGQYYSSGDYRTDELNRSMQMQRVESRIRQIESDNSHRHFESQMKPVGRPNPVRSGGTQPAWNPLRSNSSLD